MAGDSKKIAGSGLEIDDSKEGVIAYGYIDELCGFKKLGRCR